MDLEEPPIVWFHIVLNGFVDSVSVCYRKNYLIYEYLWIVWVIFP
jgi:hypothetical protein